MERFNHAVDRFEKAILVTLTVFVAVVVLAAAVSMVWLMVERLLGPGHLIENVGELPEVFGAFLMVLIGLELLETLKVREGGNRVRVTMVLIAALIAMGRKIIVFEPESQPTEMLLGIAAIILALGVTLYLWARVDPTRRAGTSQESPFIASHRRRGRPTATSDRARHVAPGARESEGGLRMGDMTLALAGVVGAEHVGDDAEAVTGYAVRPQLRPTHAAGGGRATRLGLGGRAAGRVGQRDRDRAGTGEFRTPAPLRRHGPHCPGMRRGRPGPDGPHPPHRPAEPHGGDRTGGDVRPASARTRAQGMRVATPLLPRPNKSVVASLLERQPTLTPRYNYTLLEPLRDCGVVWGSGVETYTGEAGYGPASLERQWEAGARQVDPKGPAQTDFFRLLSGAQGTLGIVTWASIKLELLPAARAVCFVTAPRLDDLLDLTYRLLRVRLGDELFVANAPVLARLLAAAEAGRSGTPGPYAGASDASPEAAAALARRVATLRDTIPEWTLVVALGGRAHLAEERLAAQRGDLDDLAHEYGHEVQTTLPGADAVAVEAALRGLDATSGWRAGGAGADQEVFFHTTLDKAPGFVATMLDVADRAGYPAADVGVYLQPQHQGVAYHWSSASLTPGDAAEAGRACAPRTSRRARG